MATNQDPFHYGRKAPASVHWNDQPAEKYDWSIDNGTRGSLLQENADLITSASEMLYVFQDHTVVRLWRYLPTNMLYVRAIIEVNFPSISPQPGSTFQLGDLTPTFARHLAKAYLHACGGRVWGGGMHIPSIKNE